MSKNKKPLILVVNDDGITAPGIKALIEVAEKIGEVVVVAPDSPQSGMGHAITLGKPLRLKENKLFEPIKAYECSGTPVDCVKIAVDKVLKRKPDLCISGINHGSNESCNVIYSGTMSAAVEAAIEGIPSVGFSLLDFDADADFTYSKVIAKKVIKNILENGLAKDITLNVNIPKGAEKDSKGIKVCRQARGNWEEKFDHRKDPHGRNYYWLTGDFANYDKADEDADSTALEQNFVSIVPIQFDLTAYHAIESIKKWEL